MSEELAAATLACASRAALRDSVDGRAYSRFNSLIVSESTDRKLVNAEWSLYWEEFSKLLMYVARPDLRSAISLSSAQADGRNAVTRIRFGGRLSLSPIVLCSSRNCECPW